MAGAGGRRPLRLVFFDNSPLPRYMGEPAGDVFARVEGGGGVSNYHQMLPQFFR